MTATRRSAAGSAPIAGRAARPWLLPVAVGLLAAAGTAVLVGAPIVNGDTMFHLVWGRELLHGELDGFANGPTPHPLLVAAGALTALLGEEGSRHATYAVFGPAALGAMVAAVVALGRSLAGTWAGVVAAGVLLTSLPVLANAATARYDVAFAALVVGAVALEVARPRRGALVLACLAVAGLIRPEAWLLSGAYWLWIAPGLSWPARLRLASVVVAPPVIWAGMDTLVTGDPLYSLHVTERGSDAFYRQYTPAENLAAAWRNLISYTGVVSLALLPFAAFALVRARQRVAVPLLATLGITMGIFLLFLSRGLASSERYLFVPACLVAVLAGFAAAGGGRLTRPAVMAAVFASVFLVFQGFARADVFGKVADQAATVQARAQAVADLVHRPGVAAALRECPSVAVPSNNMIQLFAYHSGRSPDRFHSDGRGRTRPDLYVAPGNDEVAEELLTRARFDDDPTFRVPPSLRAGPRNGDWMIHLAPGSPCVRSLR